jgi:glutaredoxin-like protein
MLVKDGVIEKMFIEADVPGDPFEVSDADTMLDYINADADKPAAVSIITRPGCPFCAQAKRKLSAHGMEYDEISLGTHAAARSVRAITGRDTVPQVFINSEHIGGSEELEAYLARIDSRAKQAA